MSYLSEGDVSRHEKFDNFLCWSADMAGVKRSHNVVRGTVRSNSEILSNQLSARKTNFVDFLFSLSFMLQQGSEIFSKIREHVIVNKR